MALTFDAEHPDRPWCPPGNAERVLDTLGDRGARATFFVQGRWAGSQPAAAKRIADEDHLVGHHSHYHARMPLLSDEGLASDLTDGHDAVLRATAQLVASAGSLAAFAGLHWFISRTETGLALQATAQDRQAASLMGIDTQRMFALGWGIGAACVGVAGALLSMFFYIFPEVGVTFSLLAYVAVALGGFGNVPGTLVAGVVVGLVEVLGGLLIAPALKYAVVFAIYLVVVLWRPQGLFGRF